MSLSLDLNKFAKLSEKKLETVVKKTFIQLSTAVIKDTPVDSGRLRGNWQPAINKYEEDVTDTKDKSGAKAISNVVIDANRYKLGDTLTMSNNLPYAHRIEYLGWSKVKSPSGMVRKNILSFKKWVDKIAKEIR